MTAWALRHCSRLNCSVIPAVVFIGFIAVLLVAAHRSGVRETVLAAGIAAAGCIILGLAAAIAAAVARSRRPAPPARQRQPAETRTVTRRAAAGLPGSPRPAACACGRLAETRAGGLPACRQCAAGAEAAGRAEFAASELAGYALGQPPVIPAGETIGLIDMSAFEPEKDASP